MSDTSQVANPGSTLGEAVGALVEKEVNRLIRPIAEEYGYVYLTAGKPNPRTARTTKLLLQDTAGNKFQVDSVIANPRIQPLVLFQSLYSHKEEHESGWNKETNEAHSGFRRTYSTIRRTYSTIRQSIAVLAGYWNESSKALLRSSDVTLFEVGRLKTISVLAEYGIAVGGHEEEKERVKAMWLRWRELSDADYDVIAHVLLEDIGPELCTILQATLKKRISYKTGMPLA